MISEPVVELVKAVTWGKKWEEHTQKTQGYQNLCPRLPFASTQHPQRDLGSLSM